MKLYISWPRDVDFETVDSADLHVTRSIDEALIKITQGFRVGIYYSTPDQLRVYVEGDRYEGPPVASKPVDVPF